MNDEGAIEASYSADTICMSGKVRQPFNFRGAQYICVSRHANKAGAYRLVPVAAFIGTPTTYAARCKENDGDTARNDPQGFYNGMAVAHGGQKYILAGPEIELNLGDELEQLDLFGSNADQAA